MNGQWGTIERMLRQGTTIAGVVYRRSPLLHQALSCKLGPVDDRISLIKAVVELSPDSLLIPNAANDLPIHVALKQTQNFVGRSKSLRGLILIFMNARPASLIHQGRHGQTPLHAACVCTRNACLIQAMIDLEPRALHIEDDDGLLPIQRAVMNKSCQHGSFQALYRADPSLLQVLNPDGKSLKTLALEAAIDRRPMNLILNEIEGLENGTIDVQGMNTDSLQHTLKDHCENQAWPALLAIMNENPGAALITFDATSSKRSSKREYRGTTVLHYAISVKGGDRNARHDLVDCILKVAPGALKIRSGDGMLPLHHFCNSNHEYTFSAPEREGRIVTMCEMYPESLLMTGGDEGWTPLHFAISSKLSTKLIKSLVTMEPRATNVVGNQGFVPIQVLCTTYCTEGKLKALVGANPASLYVTTRNGENLLVLARRSRGAHTVPPTSIAWIQSMLKDGIGAHQIDSQVCDDRCLICLDMLTFDEQSVVDGCEHEFCFDCILEWSNRDTSCPLCRKEFTKIDRVHKHTRALPKQQRVKPKGQASA